MEVDVLCTENWKLHIAGVGGIGHEHIRANLDHIDAWAVSVTFKAVFSIGCSWDDRWCFECVKICFDDSENLYLATLRIV